LRGYLGQDLSDGEVERICAVKEVHFRHLVETRGIQLLPGVHRWLAHLRGEGWRQAIASSAPRLNIEMILGMLDLTRYFDALVSAEDVQRGKPDPQVFLVAAERVAVPPARCLAVEDAPVGVESARRAGMRVIGVRSTHPTLEADYTAQTLDDLPVDVFDRLLRK
jgi:HAD superfamily hydrolase (TIGR01509 family)